MAASADGPSAAVDDRVALALEVGADERQDLRVVVDDEDGVCAGTAAMADIITGPSLAGNHDGRMTGQSATNPPVTIARRSVAPSTTRPRVSDGSSGFEARRAGGGVSRRRARSGRQSTTIPNGAAPPGIEVGEPPSSVSEVPSMAKAETFAAPASTTYR